MLAKSKAEAVASVEALSSGGLLPRGASWPEEGGDRPALGCCGAMRRQVEVYLLVGSHLKVDEIQL